MDNGYGNKLFYKMFAFFLKELGTPNDKIWPGPPAYSELPAVKKVF